MNKLSILTITIFMFAKSLAGQDLEVIVTNEICDCLQNIKSGQPTEILTKQVGDCISRGIDRSDPRIESFISDKKNKKRAYRDFYSKVIFLVYYHDHKSFELMNEAEPASVQIISDSLKQLYNNWNPSQVKTSSNPVDITKGTFETVEDRSFHSLLIVKKNRIYEVMPFNLDTVEFRVERMGKYKYKTIYIGSKKGFDPYKPGQEFIIKVTKITDTGYSVLIPFGKDKIWSMKYRKLAN